MKEEQKKLVAFIGALLAIALFLWWLVKRSNASVEAAASPPDSSDFYAPYYYPSPGNYPEVAPFESTVNVNVDLPALGMLANQYIPIFGLVGMTAVKG